MNRNLFNTQSLIWPFAGFDAFNSFGVFADDKNSGSVRHRYRNRLAVTLIELLVVLSVSAVLMSLVGVWTFKLLQFSAHIRLKQDDMNSLNRLAVDFRQDVRFADLIKIGSSDELELQYPGGERIFYRLHNDQFSSMVHVERKIGDQLIRREEYRLSDNCFASWETSELPDWISLVIFRRSHFLSTADRLEKKDDPQSIAPVADMSAVPHVDVDPSTTVADRCTLVELQVRVAPRRWREWKIVDED